MSDLSPKWESIPCDYQKNPLRWSLLGSTVDMCNAYHEAAHAVSAIALRRVVEEAWIHTDLQVACGILVTAPPYGLVKRSSELPAFREQSPTRDCIVGEIAITMAGPIAQARLTKSPFWLSYNSSGGGDIRNMNSFLARVTSSERESILEEANELALRLGKRFERATLAVARNLQLKGKLEGNEILEIVEAHGLPRYGDPLERSYWMIPWADLSRLERQ